MLRCDDLVFQGPLQGGYPVTLDGGFFKGQVGSGLAHLLLQVYDNVLIFALEQEDDLPDHGHVFCIANQVGTGGQASSHLIVEAGALTAADRFAAPERKHGKEQFQGRPHGAC